MYNIFLNVHKLHRDWFCKIWYEKEVFLASYMANYNI